MGYYTSHTLEVIGGDDLNGYWENKISDTTDYAGMNVFEGEPIKWYSCDDDMKSFSANYPDVLFIVYGEGEDSGDLWKAYYKNGKQQREQAVVTYGAFDESKLT